MDISFSAFQPQLENWLKHCLNKNVKITWTKNKNSIFSFKRNKGIKNFLQSNFELRIHEAFKEAPEKIWIAVVIYLSSTEKELKSSDLKSVMQVLDQFISGIQHHLQTTFKVKGQFFDLSELFEILNKKYFNDECTAKITWRKRSSPKRRKKSITLGNYSHSGHLIRINPVLDQEWIPVEYVSYVIFHEMLHAQLGVEIKNGRKNAHTPEFKAIERTFPYFDECMQWEKEHISQLLHKN